LIFDAILQYRAITPGTMLRKIITIICLIIGLQRAGAQMLEPYVHQGEVGFSAGQVIILAISIQIQPLTVLNWRQVFFSENRFPIISASAYRLIMRSWVILIFTATTLYR
jgi:hypothetical protein